MHPDGLSVCDWMSVTALVLPGAYDDDLQWPTEGSLTVEVLNQQGDCGHFSKEIDFVRLPRKWKQRAHYAQRYDHSDRWGILQFISYQNLLEEVDGHCYVVDGTIYL